MVEVFREAARHTGGKLMVAEHGIGLPGARTDAFISLVGSLLHGGAKVDGVALRLRLRVREDPALLLRALSEDRATGPRSPSTPPYSPSPHGTEYLEDQRGPGAVVFDWEAWRATVRQQLARVEALEDQQARALAAEMESAVRNATADGSDPGAALADTVSDLILPALGVGPGAGSAGNLTVSSLLPLVAPPGAVPTADGSGSGYGYGSEGAGGGAGTLAAAARRALALQLSRILGRAVYHFKAEVPPAATGSAAGQATGMGGSAADPSSQLPPGAEQPSAGGPTEAGDEAAAQAESESEEQRLEDAVADEIRREQDAGAGEDSAGSEDEDGRRSAPSFEPLFDYGSLWQTSPHSGPEHRDHSPGGLATFSRFLREPHVRVPGDAAAAPDASEEREEGEEGKEGKGGGATPPSPGDGQPGEEEEGEEDKERPLTPRDLGLPRLDGAGSADEGAFSLPLALLDLATGVRDGAAELPPFPRPARTPYPAPRVYGREALGMDNFTAADVAEGEDQPPDLSQPLGTGDYPEGALRRRATRVLNTALNAQYSGRATMRRDPRGERSEEHLYMDVTRKFLPALRTTVERLAALGLEVHLTGKGRSP